MKNILKRQDIRTTIDGLKVKNPTPEQKTFIQNTISENFKIDQNEDILVSVQGKENTGIMLIKYMLKNLVEGIEDLTEEDIEEAIKDPSFTLRKINVEFNSIVSEITQEMLLMMITDLKETNALSDASIVFEKIDSVLKEAQEKQAKSKENTEKVVKKKGRPKKVQ